MVRRPHQGHEASGKTEETGYLFYFILFFAKQSETTRAHKLQLHDFRLCDKRRQTHQIRTIYSLSAPQSCQD